MSAPATPAGPAAAGNDFGHAALAEWTKFRTVRSSFWTLVISVVLTVSIGAAVVPFVIDDYSGPPGQAAAFAIREGWWFEGLHVGIFAVMVLGVLMASAEYGTGTIRATLAAVPSRPRALAAKILNVTAVALVAGVIQALAVFLAAQPILADRSIDVSVTDPTALRGVAMATLAVTGAGLFGLGTGLLIRHSAGALGAIVAVMFVLPGIAQLLPDSWNDAVRTHPTLAMNAMFTPHSETLAVGPATAVFFGYIVLLLAIAGALFARRDA